ncbi:DUF3761 domain-containing protein [Catenulispora sp. GP43]|uniref:DUF3761 domain-containing protein n=1 Tax=Catenulispora sp. GP43 TaxID=3156263 RepID=UPI00351343FA
MRSVPTTTAVAPPSHPVTTKAPAAAPTSTEAATCVDHATIDEGTARCGAGESHPSGAEALCHDGTYSYSTTAQGTCSRHKGVAVWYY